MSLSNRRTCGSTSLPLGCVKYLNARPLIGGWPGYVTFDHPAALSDQLQRGALQIALVSSFEFLRHPVYWIVDDVAIASDGPVYSVFVAHSGDWSAIEAIELDPASQTSANLLRCLLAEMGQETRLAEQGAEITSPLAPRRARLLIGDQAIWFREKFGGQYRYWDLGGEWQRLIGLPFVFAFWLIRPEVADPKAIARRLRALRDANLANIDNLIAAETNFDRDFCARYYREHLRFRFGEEEKKGLRKFQELCVKYGLLPNREIEFTVV